MKINKMLNRINIFLGKDDTIQDVLTSPEWLMNSLELYLSESDNLMILDHEAKRVACLQLHMTNAIISRTFDVLSYDNHFWDGFYIGDESEDLYYDMMGRYKREYRTGEYSSRLCGNRYHDSYFNLFYDDEDLDKIIDVTREESYLMLGFRNEGEQCAKWYTVEMDEDNLKYVIFEGVESTSGESATFEYVLSTDLIGVLMHFAPIQFEYDEYLIQLETYED